MDEPCITYEELQQIPKSEYVFLGQGTFGRAYKLRDVVVKVMILVGPAKVRMFLAETDTWKELAANPGLAPYMPKFCWSNLVQNHGYIVQRYEEVKSLYDYIVEARDATGALVNPIPYKLGISLFHNLIKGLDALYKAGYVHRDIKPGNILVRTGLAESDPLWGVPMFIDFGVACKMPCKERLRVGTQRFFPPNWLPLERRYETYGINIEKNTANRRGKSQFKNISNIVAPSYTRKKLLRMKTQPAAMPPNYSLKSDIYALAITLEDLFNSIDWRGHEARKAGYYGRIQRFKMRMISELAAQKARGDLNSMAEALAEFKGSFFQADAPRVAEAPERNRNPLPEPQPKRRPPGNSP